MSERIPPIEPEDLIPEQKEAYSHISKAAEESFGDAFTYKTPSGALIGPFAPLLATPSICKRFFEFMSAVSGLQGLPASARETAILAIGPQYQAPYEIYAHERVALKNTSLTKEQINAIKNGREESVAFDVAVELAGGKGPLGRERREELVQVCGLHGYTCLLLNGCDVRLPEEGEDLGVDGKN